MIRSDGMAKLNRLLSSLADITPGQAAAMRAGNTVRWLGTMIRIAGSELTEPEISAILGGDLARNATFGEVDLISRLEGLRKEFAKMADFEIRPDAGLIRKVYGLLTGSREPAFRQSTTRIEVLRRLPPHPSEIVRRMRALEVETLSDAHYENPLDGALQTHDMLVRIWPFEKSGELMPFLILSYELLLAGYPLPAPEIRAEDYFGICRSIFDGGGHEPLDEMILESACRECLTE